MHILHLLSQYEVTGAEVYAAQLARWQMEHGHKVWIVSDTFSTPTEATYIARPIGEKALGQRLGNIAFVRRLIRQEGIQVVHAHSRAASKVGEWAVRGTEAPLVSTIHGRQHWHGRLKRYDVYGQAVIAVCPNIATHLVQELGMDAAKIGTIPNGVRISEPPQAGPVSGEVVLLAGRTSGPKGELTARFLAEHAASLLNVHPNLALHLAGGALEHLPAEGREALAALQARYGSRVQYLGFVRDLPERIRASRLVVGSGRVAIEALGLGTPVVAAGEAQVIGFVHPERWQQAAASNFGDIAAERDLSPPSVNELAKGIFLALAAQVGPDAQAELARQVRAYYDLDAVANHVLEVYRSTRVRKLRPGYIPVLMYHKVPLEPIESPHRVFVTRDTLEHQLRQLQGRGFEGITFQDYERFRNGEPGARMPRRPIVLTFDDAYLDNYTNAWPLLRRYGFPAVIYALGRADHDHNFWDTPSGEARQPLMSAAQKQEMAAAGIEFGAHTQNHVDLTTIDPDTAWAEIADSRAALQSLTGQPVLSFAYPYGRYTPEIKELVRRAGFRYGVVISGGGMSWEDDLLEIFRVYVFPEDRGLKFWKKSSAWYRAYFKRKRGV